LCLVLHRVFKHSIGGLSPWSLSNARKLQELYSVLVTYAHRFPYVGLSPGSILGFSPQSPEQTLLSDVPAFRSSNANQIPMCDDLSASHEEGCASGIIVPTQSVA